MEKVILKKENGVVVESTRNVQVSSKPYMTNEESCFDVKIDKNNFNQEIRSTKKAVYSVINELSKNNDNIVSLYSELKKVKKYDELINYGNLILEKYQNFINSKNKKRSELGLQLSIADDFKTAMSKNPELLISIAVKRIISVYYLNKLMLLTMEDVNKLQNLKISGASVETMLDFIDEKFPKSAMSNGIKNLSEKIFVDTIDIVFDKVQTHLCWENCKNATASQCPKIADSVKQKIEDYQFITDGYQIFDENGAMDSFIVTGCKNYRKEVRKELTPKEKEKIRLAKEAIRMLYFDAGSIEEAHVIQAELEEKGQLQNIRGRRPSKEAIKTYKLNLKR